MRIKFILNVWLFEHLYLFSVAIYYFCYLGGFDTEGFQGDKYSQFPKYVRACFVNMSVVSGHKCDCGVKK